MKAFVKRGSALFSISCLRGGVLGNLKEQFGWGHLRQNLLVSVIKSHQVRSQLPKLGNE